MPIELKGYQVYRLFSFRLPFTAASFDFRQSQSCTSPDPYHKITCCRPTNPWFSHPYMFTNFVVNLSINTIRTCNTNKYMSFFPPVPLPKQGTVTSRPTQRGLHLCARRIIGGTAGSGSHLCAHHLRSFLVPVAAGSSWRGFGRRQTQFGRSITPQF